MTTIPTVNAGELPWLSVDQMIEADRLAIEEFDIGLLQMMEHAGSGLAELAMLTAPSGRITVLAGGGNNGGGGLCAARHLINRGRDVDIVLATGAPGPAAAHHLRTLAEMGVNPRPEPGYTPVVVDALVGYGLQGPLRGRAAELARWAAMIMQFPAQAFLFLVDDLEDFPLQPLLAGDVACAGVDPLVFRHRPRVPLQPAV